MAAAEVDFYELLEVERTADDKTLKSAYRRLAMRYHPDRSTHEDAEKRFNAIQKAYELLSDPKQRAAYNQSMNNRIIIDPDNEAYALWHALFERCGIVVPREDHTPH